MSKNGIGCYCTKKKEYEIRHTNQPFFTHLQRSDLRRCLVAPLVSSIWIPSINIDISAHPWVSWETEPVRRLAQLCGASNRSEGNQPTLQAEAWELNFDILSHFPLAFLCFQAGNTFRVRRGALQWICSTLSKRDFT